MAGRFEDAPEVAPQSYPEPYGNPQPPSQQQHYQFGHSSSPNPEQQIASPQTGHTAVASSYAPSHLKPGVVGAPYPQNAQQNAAEPPVEAAPEKKRATGATTICGCSLLVFVLGVIIAILAAAVIGLAAGTGVEANRANDANEELRALRASVSSLAAGGQPTTSGTPSSTTGGTPSASAAPVVIDNGCATAPDLVTGQTKTSTKVMGLYTFTMQCNRDVNGTNVMSLFAADWDSCMDACAGYNMWVPQLFGKNDNSTCDGVSFIPAWTDKRVATNGQAPGNCYLKKAPLTNSAFVRPTAGTPVHGAIVIAQP